MNIDIGEIAAIVLAAGEGKRIGQPKALVKMEEKSFLEIIVSALQKIMDGQIVVVGGAAAEDVRQCALSMDVDFALNEKWQSGQFSSLKIGLSKLKARPGGVLVTLVDHPLVKPRTYSLLISTHKDNPKAIIIPVHGQRRGHPVIIPGAIIDEIKNTPDDSNLRAVIRKHRELIIERSVDDGGVLKDIDTTFDLKDAQSI